jgi:glycosyltransferase involved in cell wall biosynthesis
MITTHRWLKTWHEQVDVYVVPTEFARKKFIEGGWPAEKTVVKPNFVLADTGPGEGRGEYALFVGRLSSEKGVDTLLAAWERLRGRVPLKIVGDGPLASQVIEGAGRVPEVECLGQIPLEEVFKVMGEATFLVFPSESYETFGLVAIEAFARGTPVIASRIGAVTELVEPGRTGLHFRPGDSADLVEQVEWALAHPRKLAQMRREARAEFEAKYTAEQNYRMLMEIYEVAMARARRRLPESRAEFELGL